MKCIYFSVLFFLLSMIYLKHHYIYDKPITITHAEEEYNITCNDWHNITYNDMQNHYIQCLRYNDHCNNKDYETCSIYQRLYDKCIKLRVH